MVNCHRLHPCVTSTHTKKSNMVSFLCCLPAPLLLRGQPLPDSSPWIFALPMSSALQGTTRHAHLASGSLGVSPVRLIHAVCVCTSLLLVRPRPPCGGRDGCGPAARGRRVRSFTGSTDVTLQRRPLAEHPGPCSQDTRRGRRCFYPCLTDAKTWDNGICLRPQL